jgi:hypothetical protein
MTLVIQNLYNDPQGNALNSIEGIIMFIVIGVFFLVWYAVTGGDMGTHSDTGAPIKSLNTKEGKRAGQRRRYHENKGQAEPTYNTPRGQVKAEDFEDIITRFCDRELQDIEDMKDAGAEDWFGTPFDVKIAELIAERDQEIAEGATVFYRKHNIK